MLIKEGDIVILLNGSDGIPSSRVGKKFIVVGEGWGDNTYNITGYDYHDGCWHAQGKNLGLVTKRGKGKRVDYVF